MFEELIKKQLKEEFIKWVESGKTSDIFLNKIDRIFGGSHKKGCRQQGVKNVKD